MRYYLVSELPMPSSGTYQVKRLREKEFVSSLKLVKPALSIHSQSHTALRHLMDEGAIPYDVSINDSPPLLSDGDIIYVIKTNNRHQYSQIGDYQYAYWIAVYEDGISRDAKKTMKAVANMNKDGQSGWEDG